VKIEIRQPHRDYPFAWVLVEKTQAPRHVDGILAAKGITVLGPWEQTELFFRAPVLLEYEHTKPRKRAAKR
jgi:hypothetical protein